jgi:hypothetical protein
MRGAPKGVEKEEVFEGSAATKDGIFVRTQTRDSPSIRYLCHSGAA